MSDLGDLLELLHDADASWTTLRARYRIVRHDARALAAFHAHAEQTGATTFGPGRGGRREPAQTEETFATWRAQPDRVRVEHAGGSQDGAYGVTIGERWWHWNPNAGAISNEADPSVGGGVGDELAILFAPAPLLGNLRLAPAGRGSRAGRDCLLATGLPRPFDHAMHFGLHALGLGADHYRLEIDSRSGLVLGATAFRSGEPFHEIAALELEVEVAIDDERFAFLPPPGEQVLPPLHLREVVHRHVSIAEAQGLAPFTLLIPERVPASWEVRCSYFAGSDRPSAPPSASISYRSKSGHEDLALNETSAAEPNRWHTDGWAARSAGELTVHVRGRGDPGGGPQSQLVLEDAGTRVVMISTSLSGDQLVALASMLISAPAASPLGES